MADDEYTMHFAARLYEQLQPPLPGGAGQAKAIIQVFLNELLDAERLTPKPQAPVAGYTTQPDAKVALVNLFKQDEERLLRKLDRMTDRRDGSGPTSDVYIPPTGHDQRWLAIARTHFQEGFMALNRAVFQPTRIKLPEDGGE